MNRENGTVYVSLWHDLRRHHFRREQINLNDVSEDQRNKLAAAGDFELAEDSVNVLFHRR
jgi:hypothetical protein